MRNWKYKAFKTVPEGLFVGTAKKNRRIVHEVKSRLEAGGEEKA